MQRSLIPVLRTTLRSSLVPLSSSSALPFRLLSTAPPPPQTPSNPHPYLSQIDADGSTVPPSSSAASTSSSGPRTAGPFPLPSAASAAARADAISAASRKWKQMGTAGKVGVVATQGGSFFVVLGGAVLLFGVGYALVTEMFSEASPTKIFQDCVDRVRDDPELTSMLLPPLVFHGTASGSRSRHRRISHSYTIDPQTGLETLFVRFWIEARDPHSTEEESWMDWAKRWIGPAIFEDSHNPGAYQPRLDSEVKEEEKRVLDKARKVREEEERRKSWGGWISSGVSNATSNAFGGLFGGSKGFRGSRGEGEEAPGLFKRQRKPKLGEHATGEVVAELEKDHQTGHFVYKQLFVAIPDTHTPSYYRHNISTANIIPSEERGLDRFKFWHKKVVVAA